jgi:glycosyltransferase involved in cell wall biosynthesis
VPTVFLEALRCGVPVIGADVGSVGDIIRDGKTGWLVKSNSVDDLVRALSECMRDYPRACELCKHGQELLLSDFKAADSAEVMVRAWTQQRDGR